MSTDMHLEPPMNHLPEAVRESARRAADAAKENTQKAAAAARDVAGAVETAAGEVTDATKDAARCATDKVKDMYHSAALKAEDTLATSKEYVRRNPMPVVLGAVAFGAALGYILMTARREQTFGERYADEPLGAVREAILSALAPVAHTVHRGYDSARDGAGRAMDRVHGLGMGRSNDSWSHHIGRLGHNLKFW